jgi:hypothetical protein
MKLKLKAYLAQTDVNIADFAEEIGTYRQRVEWWIKKNMPVIVEIEPKSWKVLQVRMEKITVIYSAEEE